MLKEWSVFLSTKQLFYGEGCIYPEQRRWDAAAEAPAVEKGLRRRKSGYFGAAGEVGCLRTTRQTTRARLRCGEK